MNGFSFNVNTISVYISVYIRKACLRSTEANHEQAYLRSVYCKGDQPHQLGEPQLRR